MNHKHKIMKTFLFFLGFLFLAFAGISQGMGKIPEFHDHRTLFEILFYFFLALGAVLFCLSDKENQNNIIPKIILLMGIIWIFDRITPMVISELWGSISIPKP